MGSKYDGIGLGFQSPQPASLRLNYIQLPLPLRAYLPLPGPVSPHLFGGPFVDFLTGMEFCVGDQLIPKADEWYRDSDFGFVIGMGTKIGLRVVDIALDARLLYGMENIFDQQFEYDEQNRAINFSAGVLF